MIFLWLGACNTISEECGYDTVDHGNEIDKIFHSVAKQIKKELNYSWYWCQQEQTDGILKEVYMDFNVHDRATIEEARALDVLITDKLVRAINENENIRPYLQEYPFPSHRVGIDISFLNSSSNHPQSDGSVSSVRHICSSAHPRYKNQIIYRSDDAFAGYEDFPIETFRSVDIFEESYEEAEKIIRESFLQILPKHQSTEQELAIDEVFLSFINQMQKKHGFSIWTIGCKMPNLIEEIHVQLRIFHRASQREAKNLLVCTTKSLLKIINVHEKLRPYLKQYPFTSDRLKIRLMFRRKGIFTISNYKDGSIESVTLDNNKITYRRDSFKNENAKVIEEPYPCKN